jgi:hypothetical protein
MINFKLFLLGTLPIRRALTDSKIYIKSQNKEYNIRKGDNINFFTVLDSYSEENYKNANEFDENRFLKNDRISIYFKF